jgi:hypothetical protein
MNANGTINVQDFATFSSGYGAGVPGPSAWKCASAVAGSDNLTGKVPCDWMTSFRVKCGAATAYGAGSTKVIISTVTGSNLRFQQNADFRTTGAGSDYGHCS